MMDRKGSDMSPAGGRGSRRTRRSRFHDAVQGGPGTLPIGKIARRTPAKPPYLRHAGVAHARRFGLLSDRSGPPPVPGPLLSPLIGGLPGSSLLIGQQAACLQLERIKTQLALSQISNAIVAGGRAAASRSVSNTPPCFVSTQAPSPTATAINLLNLLKVANMSHKLYNPCSLESQDCSLYPPPSAKVDPGNVREPSHMVPGSTPASIGASFRTSMNPSNIQPSMQPGSVGYIPGQSQPATEFKSDIHIKQARGSILKKPARDQNTLVTAWPEVSLGSGPTGYTSSTPICQGSFSGYPNTVPSGIVRGASNLPSSYQTKSSDTSYNFDPSSSHSAPNITHPSNYSRYSIGEAGNIGSSSKPSSTVAGSGQSTRWSGEHVPSDCPSSSKNAAYSQARYTCESAMDILKRFDLQEEDLEVPCAYPDDQLSPANQPYLVRDIIQKKVNRSLTASPSSRVHQAQGSLRAPETTVGLGADGKRAVEAPSAFQQPSKVIEYGHTSKYTVGIWEEDKDRGPHRISIRPRSLIESGLMGSSSSQNTSHRLAPGTGTTSHKPTMGTETTSHKGAPGVGTTNQRPAPGIGTTSHKPTPGTGITRHKAAPGVGTTSHKPTPGAGTTSQRPAQGAGTTSLRPPTGTGTTRHKAAPGVGTSILRPTPGTDSGAVLSPQSIPTNQRPPPASDVSIQRPPPVKPAGKRMLTAALISDYMGDTPGLFPHTCSLCNKPCVGMKDWLDHKKHIDHRASCQLLSRQYSEWEPDAVTFDSAPEKSQHGISHPMAVVTPMTTAVPASSTQSSGPSLPATSHGGPAPSNSAPPLTSSCGNKSTSSVDRKTLETGKSQSPQRTRSRSKSSGRKRSWSKSSGSKGSRSKSSGRKISRSKFSRRKRSTSSASSGSPDWKQTSGRASSPLSSRPVHSRRSHSQWRSSSNSSSSSSSSSDRYRVKRPSSPARRSRRRSGSPRRGRRSRSHSPLRRTRKSRSGSRSPHPSSQRRRSRSHDRRSLGHCQEETSVERLARKLLEFSGVQSLTGSTSLELVAPVLLAELAKLKAASSSSSASSKDQKKPSSSSSSRDEQKQSFSSSRDEKKPSSSSSSRDEKKPSSSNSRDEQRESTSSSSRNEKKRSSSSRDEQKPSSSSSQDDQKQSSSSRDEQKPSSSSSQDDQKQASSSSTKGGKEPPSSSSSSSAQGIKKVLAKKSVPTKSAKPQGSGLLGFVPAHPPLLLSGLPSTVTQQQVFSAVEKLGKTRFISLAEHRQEATVYFLQATAAKALLSFTELKIGGNPISVTQIPKSVFPKPKKNQASTKPGSKALPGNKTTLPGNKTTSPGDKTTTPGGKTAPPGNKTTTASDKTTTPSNKRTSPGDQAITPGDTNMSIDTIISSRPVTTASVPFMSLPPDTAPCSLEKSHLKQIECVNVRSWTLADCDPDPMRAERPSSRPHVPRLHPGGRISPTALFLKSIKCIDVLGWTLADFQPFASRGATIMVTGLPAYREPEMIRVLEGFGKTKRDKYFILPDNCMAFVEMAASKMERLMDLLANGVSMNGGMLRCHLLKENALRSPMAFYKQLLTWSEKLYDDTTLEYRLVYISNIPAANNDFWMEAFHEGITKTGGVRLYLPLMGKIFVEFVTVEDADRFGVWLSSFSPDPRVENLVHVTRPGMVPDMDATGPVCTNIMRHKTVLNGLQPPFWLVVPTRPHLYPTLSPQFYNPAHRTVNGPRDVQWAEVSIIGQSVVMVTGLPLGGYRHVDLVDEVWPYFVEKDVSRVFYSVVILPLQRRAFIHFDDGVKCKKFVSDFLHKPFTIGGCDLTLHFLLDHLEPCSTELKLYNRLLQWSHVVPKEKATKDRLLMTAIEYCSMRALKFIFDIMENTQYLSCLVLSNRVVFQIPRETDMYNVIANLSVENDKLFEERSIYFPKPYHFETQFKFMRSKTVPRRLKGSCELAASAAPTTSGQSAPHPSAPGQLGAPLPTYAPPPAAPAELCASAQGQGQAGPLGSGPLGSGPLGSGPRPPALSQEMYRFIATAIHQHRQARVGQEVSQEEVTDGSPPPKRERREQKSKGVSEDLIDDPPGLQEEGFKPGKFIIIDEVSDEAEPLVVFAYRSEACDSQTRPSNITKEKEVPSDRQVSEEVPRTSSYSSSTSRGVESNSSMTAHSSSLSEATVSSSSDLPKSSSSSSLPPPAGVVHTSSVVCSAQKWKEESPARVSTADEPNHREVTSITTTTEVDSPPACQPITKDESQSEAAMVCGDDMARLGHKIAAETSAVKSAASLTGKDALHTDPALEEEGKRKAQQELTLPGKDVVVSPSEDAKETRVEVDETHRQMGDEKTSDHMLDQTLVRPETPGLPDPESQTSEPQEEEMLAKVADEAEPFQEVPLKEGKMTTVEEQMPSANEETPTVVSEAADALLRGASTEEGDTHQHMDCVEGSPPEEEFNMGQSNKEPTKEEQENSKDPTMEEQATKEQNNKRPAVEEVAPEMEQRRSKRGHSGPATEPLAAKFTRRSTPTRKRESPAEDPVEVEEAASVEEEESPPCGAPIPQGQPHPKEEEGQFQVTDSVEGEVVQLPTRGKRGRPPKPTAKNVRVKKEQRTAPVPEESGKKPEEPLEDQAGPTRTETKQQEAPEPNNHIINSVEETQTADKAAPSDAKPRVSGEGVSLEEVATYQVLDSVEDEEPEVKEVPPVTRGTRGRGRKAKTPTRKDCKPRVEETVFEVLDSIGGDVAEEVPAPEQPGRPRRGPAAKEPTPEKDGKRRSGRGRKEEVPVSGTSKMAAKEAQQKDFEEEVYQVVDSIEGHPHEEDHFNSSGPTRWSRLAKTGATGTCSKASKGEEPQYQVNSKGEEPQYQGVNSKGEEPQYQVNSKGEEGKEPIPVEEQLSEEALRGKRGRKVTGSNAKTEHEATKKKKTTEQTTTPLPDNQSEARLDSESVVSRDQTVYDEEKDSSSIVCERKQSAEQAASSKVKREEEGAESKRVHSLSPSVANDYTLPPFTPCNPLGMEHVVPKAGFYCNLCSVFYEDETRATTLHCSGLGHYYNLKVFYQKLNEEQSRSQSGGSAPG